MSQINRRRCHPGMHEDVQEIVAVIGAGLAGLTAAATAAGAGRRVVVLEAHAGGGRARTDQRSGYLLNQGPHALYRGGEARRILKQLGVAHHGHQPPLLQARAVSEARSARLVSAQAARLVAKVVAASPARWAGRSAGEWIDSLGGSSDLAALAGMFVRVTTYAPDPSVVPADLALAQLKLGLLGGVSYLDGGWETLVGGLCSAASAAGAAIRRHAAVAGISRAAGGWEVALTSGEVLGAGAVVLAAGGPGVARKLLPVDPGWSELGPPITAACLDLGLRDRRGGLMFGVDQPLYLSRHCPPGDLAPSGRSLVQLMRYGARGATEDRAQLREFARLGGITDEDIAEERFLASMVVTHLLPSPEGGLSSRPAVEVPGARGLYLAGDWVGAEGWLADAAMASGRRAGLLAAGAGASRREPVPVA